jgi:hypothetical protein
MPKTKIRQNLEEFANTFLESHKDKLEFDSNPVTILEWEEENGCKWHLRKCILYSSHEPIVTEYRLRRIYEKQTKLKSEKQIFDECWVYLPHEYVHIGKLKNDSHNAIIGGYYFEKYIGYRPKN